MWNMIDDQAEYLLYEPCNYIVLPANPPLLLSLYLDYAISPKISCTSSAWTKTPSRTKTYAFQNNKTFSVSSQRITKTKEQKQSTAGIRWWSPTQLLASRQAA